MADTLDTTEEQKPWELFASKRPWELFQPEPEAPATDKTLMSQLAVKVPEVIRDWDIEFPSSLPGANQEDLDNINSIKKKMVLEEATRRVNESPIKSIGRGVAQTAQGAAEFMRTPEGLALAGLGAVAPESVPAANVLIGTMGGLTAKAVGEGAGTLSVPGGVGTQDATKEILNMALMTLGAKGSADLLKPKPEVTDAVQIQQPNEEVLRPEQPQVGLQEMGERNAKPQEAAATQAEAAPSEVPLTEAPTVETVPIAAPETITGGSGAERTTHEQTGSEIPAETIKPVRSAAAISQELKEARTEDRLLAKRVEDLDKLGNQDKAESVQSERNALQQKLSDLEEESRQKRIELSKKRLERGVRVSRSEAERPWDLIDELDSALGGKISLKKTRELIEDFKPIGAARKLFAQEGYAPDVAAQSASGFKPYPSDVHFLEALNEAGTARKTWRERFYTQEKEAKVEEAQHTAFTRDARHPGPASDVIIPETLFPGDEITVYGTKLKVKSFAFDDNGDVTSVELEDGKKYGTQHVPAGTKLFIDEKTLQQKPPSTEFAPSEPTPKLRTGEKIGEMFQGADQPFNLSGEKGIDADRLAREQSEAARRKAEGEALTAKQQEGLPLRGMGAALIGEVDKPSSFVSNMFAAIDADRKAMGKEPMPDTQRRSWDEDNTKALAKMNREPDWIPNLIEEILDRPRPLLSWENAGLVWQRQKWKAELNNALQRIATAFDGKVAESLAEAKLDAARFEDRLEELDRAVGRNGTGSEAGRTLQAQKMGAGDDFTLVEMRLQKRAAVGGRPLTDAESAEIARLHDEIESARKAHEVDVATRDQRIAEMEVQLALERAKKEAAKEPIVEPHVRIIADRIKDYFDKRADAALERLSGKLFTLSPQVLADLTDLGVSRILAGAIEFSEWSVKMADALGDRIKPHLQTVWESAQNALSEHITKVAGAKTEKVRRAVRGTGIKAQQEAVTTNIAERVKEGKRNEITLMVQKLARLFVAQGIKERNPLIDAIHNVLRGIDPSFTRRQTMDAISGYGDFKQLSKDQISRELRDLKGQMQQVAKLEDMQAGQPPLKTGLERRIPSKEESRLIKEVNDAKRKFQIPISDPNTQLRSSLDTLKKRMSTRIDELNEKMAKGEFESKPKREIALDHISTQLKVQYERAKQKFQRMLMLDRLQKRSVAEKAMDTFVKWRRGFVLSSPVTLAKLTAAGFTRLAVTPMEEVVGAGISKAIPRITERAPREGGLSVKAEAKALTQAFTQGMKDAWKTLKEGQSDLDVLHGGKLDVAVGEGLVLDKSVVDYIGHSHGMLKAPIKRAEFERSLHKRIEHAVRNGADPTDPLVMARLSTEAYKDANRSIFLQDNVVVSAWKRAMSALEQKDKATGRVPLGRKAVATTARVLLPIVKVPTNIVAEAIQYATGSVTGSVRLATAFKRGVETLKPEEADLIMRELKKGSLGAAVLLLGYFAPDLFGGYYQRGQKREEGDLKVGAARIPGVNIPKLLGGPDISPKLLHSPFLEAAQMGATIRRVAESKLREKDDDPQGIPRGILAAAVGLTEETPFVREALELVKAWNPNEQAQFFGELGKSLLVPQGAQWLAQQMDKDEEGEVVQRKPEGVLEHIKTGIPGLRKQVEEK